MKLLNVTILCLVISLLIPAYQVAAQDRLTLTISSDLFSTPYTKKPSNYLKKNFKLLKKYSFRLSPSEQLEYIESYLRNILQDNDQYFPNQKDVGIYLQKCEESLNKISEKIASLSDKIIKSQQNELFQQIIKCLRLDYKLYKEHFYGKVLLPKTSAFLTLKGLLSFTMYEVCELFHLDNELPSASKYKIYEYFKTSSKTLFTIIEKILFLDTVIRNIKNKQAQNKEKPETNNKSDSGEHNSQQGTANPPSNTSDTVIDSSTSATPPPTTTPPPPVDNGEISTDSQNPPKEVTNTPIVDTDNNASSTLPGSESLLPVPEKPTEIGGPKTPPSPSSSSGENNPTKDDETSVGPETPNTSTSVPDDIPNSSIAGDMPDNNLGNDQNQFDNNLFNDPPIGSNNNSYGSGLSNVNISDPYQDQQQSQFNATDRWQDDPSTGNNWYNDQQVNGQNGGHQNWNNNNISSSYDGNISSNVDISDKIQDGNFNSDMTYSDHQKEISNIPIGDVTRKYNNDLPLEGSDQNSADQVDKNYAYTDNPEGDYNENDQNVESENNLQDQEEIVSTKNSKITRQHNQLFQDRGQRGSQPTFEEPQNVDDESILSVENDSTKLTRHSNKNRSRNFNSVSHPRGNSSIEHPGEVAELSKNNPQDPANIFQEATNQIDNKINDIPQDTKKSNDILEKNVDDSSNSDDWKSSAYDGGAVVDLVNDNSIKTENGGVWIESNGIRNIEGKGEPIDNEEKLLVEHF